MADTHEEQLLNDLLRGIARDDERLDAAHLESRVLAARGSYRRCPTQAGHHVFGDRCRGCWWPCWCPEVDRTRRCPPARPSADAAEADRADDRRQAAGAPSRLSTQPVAPPTARVARPVAPRPPRNRPSARIANRQSPIDQSPIAQSPDEFLPLMPMTAQELTGSFQIVRVQMPRASLGALRSPLEQPNELVEADVLARRGRNGARHSRLDQRLSLSLEVSMIRNCCYHCFRSSGGRVDARAGATRHARFHRRR